MTPPSSKPFGAYIRGLRHARGFTQDRLAHASGLSPDTVRRLEGGAFSPSLDTLRKLSAGLGLSLSTLFTCFELNERDDRRLLIDLITTRADGEVLVLTRVVQTLIDELDGLRTHTRAGG